MGFQDGFQGNMRLFSGGAQFDGLDFVILAHALISKIIRIGCKIGGEQGPWRSGKTVHDNIYFPLIFTSLDGAKSLAHFLVIAVTR